MSTQLSAGQREVLRALCDTFVPPSGDPDAGTGEPLLARAESLIAAIDDAQAKGKLKLLLTALGNPLANLLFDGRPQSFAAMDLDARVRLLRGMGESAIQLRRAGFQAIKRLINVSYYSWPTKDGSHPAWREVGYPGPLPHRSDEVNRPLPLLAVERDTRLDCDVVIVGSGAGGGAAAGVLAQAGRSVVVLEKGEYHLPKDFSHVEGEGLYENYLDRGLIMTESGSLPILAGSGLGGGTVINYTTSFELPERTREEWSRRSGLDLFTSARFRESYARVKERVNVTEEWSTPGRRDQILEAGCKALGWHCGVIPRNVRGCPSPAECGYCGYGCRHNAKQSTTVTYLADAAQAGARIVVRCNVDRILIEGGRATGVVGRVRRPDGTSVTLTVHAKAVISSCGSIYGPALLVRSAVPNANIGRGLHLHPGTAVGGLFDERVESWIGHQQTRYSDQFSDQHDGYGAKFETVPLAFTLPASAFGWEGPQQHQAVMKQLANLSIVGILLRDRDSGRVATGRDGHPHVHYELSAFDIAHVRTAMRGAAELLAQQGARAIFTVQQPPAQTKPGTPGWLDRFMADADARQYGRTRQAFITFHQMASCSMGKDPRTSVIGETGESHDVKGLYVADASTFVTSSGVNPMITIMAIADHIARGIGERW
jgi:choline dehydrogenase-like flavoprotein